MGALACKHLLSSPLQDLRTPAIAARQFRRIPQGNVAALQERVEGLVRTEPLSS